MRKPAIEPWMRDELARRKEQYRKLFAGDPLERVPLEIRVCPPSNHTVRRQFQDADCQLQVALEGAHATWRLGECTDTVPAMRPDVGCSCLASAFGAEYYWGDSHTQTPGIEKPIITSLDPHLDLLTPPDPHVHGWIPEGLRRISMFAEAGDGIIPVSLLDAAGGMNVVADLLGVEYALVALYTEPDGVHRLLDMIQDLFIATIRAGIAAAGGEEYITTTDFPDFWFPEGYKGHVSDDISTNFGPEMYREFSAPYHARIFAEFGCGGLHNCGPNPCHAEYVAHPLSPRAIDLADPFSHDDLPAFKVSLKKKSFIYLAFDRLKNRELEPISWYREVMELMAPDVTVIPVLCVANVDEGRELYQGLYPISKEYARRMNWGWAV